MKKAVNIFYVLAFINALINNVFFILQVRLQFSFDTQGLMPQLVRCLVGKHVHPVCPFGSVDLSPLMCLFICSMWTVAC